MCPHEAVHPMPHSIAVCCLILNIFFPGLGTIINACHGHHAATGVIIGILQSFTAILLFGWIWSIAYGVQIVNKSKHHGGDDHYHHPGDGHNHGNGGHHAGDGHHH